MYLTEKDIAYALHSLALEMFPEQTYGEPMPQFELRGAEGLARLEAAVALPRQPYYRTKHEKAAALFRSLIKGHPLIDGNKLSPKDLVDAALGVAAYPGNFPPQTLVRWIRANCAGRPKSIVATLAEDWPETKRIFSAQARVRDIRAGRGARIPGRRLRFPPHVWETARQVINRGPIQLRLDL